MTIENSWQTKKLGEICDKASSNVSQNQLNNENGSYPIYGAKGLLKNVSFYHQDKEYIAIVKDGAGIGRIALLPPKSSVIGTLQYLLPKEGVNIKFLYYFLSSIDFLKYKNGSTIPHIYYKDYANAQILIPALSEQKRIVKILDEVFEGIEKAKKNADKNLQNSRELFESYLRNVFSNPKDDWEEMVLEDVCEIRSKLVDPRKSEFLDMIHVGAGNIEIKTGELSNLQTAKEEKLISGKFQFDDSMILYSKIRPYLMKVVRPDFCGLCSADIYPLVPHNELMIRDYLYYLLLTSGFTEYAIKGSGRAGMPKVNRNHLFAFRFFLPPIKEQKSIVAKLDALSEQTKKLEAIYKQKIADLDELKKSVLKKVFIGELR